jgi:hypothetical protein
MQPMATAGLFGESPASTPPAAPIPTRPATSIDGQRSPSIQTIQTTTQMPSVTTIAVPTPPSSDGRGLARQTVTNTMIRLRDRTVSMMRVTFTAPPATAGPRHPDRERNTSCSLGDQAV